MAASGATSTSFSPDSRWSTAVAIALRDPNRGPSSSCGLLPRAPSLGFAQLKALSLRLINWSVLGAGTKQVWFRTCARGIGHLLSLSNDKGSTTGIPSGGHDGQTAIFLHFPDDSFSFTQAQQLIFDRLHGAGLRPGNPMAEFFTVRAISGASAPPIYAGHLPDQLRALGCPCGADTGDLLSVVTGGGDACSVRCRGIVQGYFCRAPDPDPVSSSYWSQ